MARPQTASFALGTATLTLAVGANLAVFTVLNAIWLRPPPVADPDRVVVISDLSAAGGDQPIDLVKTAQLDAITRVPVFEGVTGQLAPGGMLADFRPLVTITRVGHQVETLCVASRYFSVLGVRLVGRDFRTDDDKPAAPLVGVLSDRVWRTAFGRDPGVVGSSVETSHGPMQVIGIAPSGFGGARLGEHADLWIPRAAAMRVSIFAPASRDPAFGDMLMPLIGIARLKPGVSVADAQRAIALPRTRFVVYPLRGVFGAPGQPTTVLGGRTVATALVSASLLALMGGGITLLTLLLVSFERRRMEFAVRLALGATPGQLARQLARELAIVASGGFAGGLALSALILRVLPSLRLTGSVDLARLDLSPDWRVASVGASMAVFTLIAAATLPLRRVMTGHVMAAVVSPTSTPRASSIGLRRTMLAVHAAATVIIVIGAALFLRTLAVGLTRGAGFDVDHTVFAQLQPSAMEFFDPHDDPQQDTQTPRRLAAYHEVIDALAALPGVEEVAQGTAPVGQPALSPPVTTIAAGPLQHRAPVLVTSGSPDYLRALGVHLIAGRALDGADVSAAPPQRGVISAALAQMAGDPASVVGSTISVGSRTYQIVGVVPDIPCGSLQLQDCGRVFTAAESRVNAQGVGMNLTLRSSLDASRVVASVQRAIARKFPQAVRLEVQTGRDLVKRDLSDARTGAWFFSGFGAIGLLFGLGGVFGLATSIIESRRREFGVRMALGAMPADLIRRVTSAAVWPVVTGVTIGIGLAGLLAHLIQGMTIGITTLDAPAYAAGAAGLCVSAGLAAFVCAWRLRGASPSDVLRQM